MSQQLIAHHVFISSTSDLGIYRQEFFNVLNRYNEDEARHRGHLFIPIGWEQTMGGPGRPQELINHELERCDFVIFIFRDRWGSPTDTDGTYTSGVEEEWHIASEMHLNNKINDIQTLFFPMTGATSLDASNQQGKVLEHKEKLSKSKKFLYKELNSDSDFSSWLRTTLGHWLRNLSAKINKSTVFPHKHTEISIFNNLKDFEIESTQLNKSFDTYYVLSTTQIHTKNFDAALSYAFKAKEHAKFDTEIIGAQFLIGYSYDQLGQFEKSMAQYESLIARYSKDTLPMIRDQVAKAMVVKGYLLQLLGCMEAAIFAYDDVITKYSDDQTTSIKGKVADAMLRKGLCYSAIDRDQDALQTYEKVISQYSAIRLFAVREVVAKSILNKGIALGKLDKAKEEIDAYAQLHSNYFDDQSADIRILVALGMGQMANKLAQMNKNEDAIKTYDRLIHHYSNENTSDFHGILGTSMLNKGSLLIRLGHTRDGIAIYDEIIKIYTRFDTPDLRELVANTLVWKSHIVGEQNRDQESISICDQVISRYGQANSTKIRIQVASAMHSKAVR